MNWTEASMLADLEAEEAARNDDIAELEAKLASQEVYLKRISLSVHKDRRQETLDLIESALEELKGKP